MVFFFICTFIYVLASFKKDYKFLDVCSPKTFSQVGWMTVNQLTFYFTALSTFRIRQSKQPEYISSIMTGDNRAGRIIIPNTDLTLAKNSYCFRASSQLNSLPEYIRNSRKISQFKTQLRKWILGNVPQFVGT